MLSILLVPALTMRAFAEERRTDTLELLLTAPVREVWIVLAKFPPRWRCDRHLRPTLAYAVVLGRYGEPDWGPIYGGYLALMLHAALLVAIGLLMSSLTENQVVAAALSLGTFLMLWFADSVAYLLPPPFEAVRDQPVADRPLQADGHRLGVPVRYRLFCHRVAAGAVPDDVGARAAMSVRRLASRRCAFCASVQLLLARWINLGWFAGCLAAGAASAAGLAVPARLPWRVASSRPRLSRRRFAMTILANMALFRHDAHLDLTREQAFTPSAEAQQIVRRLSEPVDLTYFYQKQDPAARALGAMLRQLERHNANFA